MGDGFYRLQDPTNNIKVLKEHRDYTINKKYNNDTINTKQSAAGAWIHAMVYGGMTSTFNSSEDSNNKIELIVTEYTVL